MTKNLIAGSDAKNLPPGTYYVGDPCYAVEEQDKWMRQLSSVWSEKDSSFAFNDHYGTIAKDPENNHWWAAHDTAFGDGIYFDQDGWRYGVDAGILGVVPEEYAEDNALDLMRKVEFKTPFDIVYSDENGLVEIGHIRIITGM